MDARKLTREWVFDHSHELKDDEKFKIQAIDRLDNAIMDFDFEYVKLLLGIGVNPSKEIIGDLAFTYGTETVRHGESALSMARLLLQAGCDPSPLSGEGWCPLEITERFGSEKFRDLLREYGGKKGV